MTPAADENRGTRESVVRPLKRSTCIAKRWLLARCAFDGVQGKLWRLVTSTALGFLWRKATITF